MKRVAAAAVAVASALVMSGCSSSSDDGKDGGDGKDGKKPGAGASRTPEAFGQDEAAMKAVAVKYWEAVQRRDWRQKCELSTQQGRDGKSVEDCAKENTPGDGGRTPATVKIEGDPQAIPASGDYLAGTGLMMSTTINGSDGRHVSRTALRMVKEGNKWLVEQRADVYDTDMRHGAPVRDALLRS
ncbi:hypothetical protein [Streptomyces abikoensis]|uniref:hypothetical protein n=1 Tax=Streptomyces abikoensis TaxID=97398 RepID=UPI0033EB4918